MISIRSDQDMPIRYDVQVRIMHNYEQQVWVCNWIHQHALQTLKSTRAFLSMFAIARKSELSFDPLKAGVSLFVHLGVYAAH